MCTCKNGTCFKRSIGQLVIMHDEIIEVAKNITFLLVTMTLPY